MTNETIDSARLLMDQLPPERPLRVRLGNELKEIRDHLVCPLLVRVRRSGRR